ncbi:hypothetical protein V6N11_039412 [Hibiscus sabdariffa]|uniref:Uncharacterized protein n=1 Tax=Hibiscus sabdariffa TaxID=183260 RepID=A0ABR2SMV1_9ROSI
MVPSRETWKARATPYYLPNSLGIKTTFNLSPHFFLPSATQSFFIDKFLFSSTLISSLVSLVLLKHGLLKQKRIGDKRRRLAHLTPQAKATRGERILYIALPHNPPMRFPRPLARLTPQACLRRAF